MNDLKRWLSVVVGASMAVAGCRSAVKDFYEPLVNGPACPEPAAEGGSGGSGGGCGVMAAAGGTAEEAAAGAAGCTGQ